MFSQYKYNSPGFGMSTNNQLICHGQTETWQVRVPASQRIVLLVPNK